MARELVLDRLIDERLSFSVFILVFLFANLSLLEGQHYSRFVLFWSSIGVFFLLIGRDRSDQTFQVSNWLYELVFLSVRDRILNSEDSEVFSMVLHSLKQELTVFSFLLDLIFDLFISFDLSPHFLSIN